MYANVHQFLLFQGTAFRYMGRNLVSISQYLNIRHYSVPLSQSYHIIPNLYLCSMPSALNITKKETPAHEHSLDLLESVLINKEKQHATYSMLINSKQMFYLAGF